VLYHLKRGRGLFKLGVGDGTTKISGFVKLVNSSEVVKSMEPCAMFLLDQKLYVRDYCQSPNPFTVFDCETLQVDTELTDKWKLHYADVLKKADAPVIPSTEPN
jgi:hypothetical protein